MARKSRSRATKTEDRADRELSYEEYTGGGARAPGVGGRRNVAPGAHEYEPEDYNEQNRRNVGGRGGKGIQTGNYEEDYGPGARGMRKPEFLTEPRPEDEGNVLRRTTASDDPEDFPTGSWSAQKATARLKQVKSRKIRARGTTGRGVGVPKPKKRKRAASAIRHPSTGPGRSSAAKPTKARASR